MIGSGWNNRILCWYSVQSANAYLPDNARPPILLIEWRAALQLVAPRLIVCKITEERCEVGSWENKLEAVVVLVSLPAE